jgi:hypothetical protein
MIRFLVKFLGQLTEWLKKARHIVAVGIFGLMFIIFMTLSIVQLVQKEELLSAYSESIFYWSLVWNIIVSVISAISILLLYELPKFENAYCSRHQNYKRYV